MLLAYHFLSIVLEHTFRESTNCKKKMIWSTLKNKLLRNQGQHCQSYALEDSKAPEVIIPPQTFRRNCHWYLECKVRHEFSSHYTCLLWEMIPSNENLPPLVNRFREKCRIASTFSGKPFRKVSSWNITGCLKSLY